MIKNRKKKYLSLCKKTGNCILDGDSNQSLRTVFEVCSECEEINLWTYWQGRKSLDEQDDSVHPKILLVGQDWGCYTQSDNETVKEQLERIDDDPEKYIKTFYSPNNGIVTDRNLKILFNNQKGLHYDLDKEQPDLFFTNLIPWYRKEGVKISGFKRAWLTPAVKEYFRELVEILEPKVIICLGKNTYHGVLDSLGLDKDNLMKQSYNTFLNSGKNYRCYKTASDFKCKVFAMAHCGGLGVRNRCIDKQVDDWRQVCKYLV